jgi:UDP-3-O-[3-hydroxymyristoyl] N-acetylglucosamine deacetylase / 3-hydroxyacyl-[acyl-carrier-protein] dehydratase
MNLEFNKNNQHTLASEACFSGPGLHSGIYANLCLKPERPGFGFRFQRIDLPGKPVILADCDLVSDTFRCTTLTDQGASISTVEHVLAALVGCGIDNCLIEVSGPEIPIVDGSCQTLVSIIEKAGRIEQDAPKIWYRLEEEISHRYLKKNVTMFALPYENYAIETFVDFKSNILEPQHAVLKEMSDFKKEIAPCRTYCFVHELEMLVDKNLLKGDIVNNAILVIDKEVSENEMQRLQKKFKIKNSTIRDGMYLNTLKLRYDNEIARHKLLDVIGDLALTGFAINAKILGIRPGHETNVDFAKRIKRQILKKNSGKLSVVVA